MCSLLAAFERERERVGWLFGLYSPLRQYFSLYLSPKEREK